MERRDCQFLSRTKYEAYKRAAKEEEETKDTEGREEGKPVSPLLFAAMLFLAVMPGIVLAFERMYGSLR